MNYQKNIEKLKKKLDKALKKNSELIFYNIFIILENFKKEIPDILITKDIKLEISEEMQ